MLMEIQCEKFAKMIGDKLVPRGKITFHEGLNTILGDKKAENSIGKSTFLLVVDFCFGGDDYCNQNICNVLTYVGHHTICFAYKFGDNIEYYSRKTNEKNKVAICNEDYSEIEKTITIKEFHEHLLNAYNITTAENTFRGIVGRYCRIYGRKNYDEQYPLKYSNESVSSAVKAIEQLYGVYNVIKNYENTYNDKKQRKDLRKNGIKLGEIPPVATSVSEVDENEKQINQLQNKLDKLVLIHDQDLSVQNMEKFNEASKIKGQITCLKRRRTRLSSQLNSIKANIDEENTPAYDEILELKEYFPNVNIECLEKIESFHNKIRFILSTEFNKEIEKLKLLIDETSKEIDVLENEQRKLGIPINISKKFLQNVVEIENRICDLKSQNKGYMYKKQLDEECERAKEKLFVARESQLSKIESVINCEMSLLNDFIYDGKQYSPEIHFSNKKSGNPAYDFGCKNNMGTGENYKNLIIFDMSILSTTELPVLIHDSLIFKNIADLPIDKIMNLYMKSKKQIFISFDKQNTFDDYTKQTVQNTCVVELQNNGGELFGWSWAKKQ